jgi:hypothetical protein
MMQHGQFAAAYPTFGQLGVKSSFQTGNPQFEGGRGRQPSYAKAGYKYGYAAQPQQRRRRGGFNFLVVLLFLLGGAGIGIAANFNAVADMFNGMTGNERNTVQTRSPVASFVPATTPSPTPLPIPAGTPTASEVTPTQAPTVSAVVTTQAPTIAPLPTAGIVGQVTISAVVSGTNVVVELSVDQSVGWIAVAFSPGGHGESDSIHCVFGASNEVIDSYATGAVQTNHVQDDKTDVNLLDALRTAQRSRCRFSRPLSSVNDTPLVAGETHPAAVSYGLGTIASGGAGVRLTYNKHTYTASGTFVIPAA